MKPFFQDRFNKFGKQIDNLGMQIHPISILRDGIGKYFLVISACVVFVGLLFRNSGIYPLVFADEYTYSKLSRLMPLADSTIPCYLYLAIYRVTSICGDGFLDGARILNALFFVFATPFIYLTARRVCTRGIASIVVLLALLGPINSFTAYFMPEAFYFFSFWVLTWFILRLDSSSNLWSWCFSGILLGLSALIKPHSLLLLPAIVLYVFYISRKKEGGWALQAFGNAVIFVVSAFLTKLLMGYFFAGKAGVTLFGPYYGAYANPAISNFQRILQLLTQAAENIQGHVLGICLMFCVPIALAIIISFKSISSKMENAEQKISFYALVVILNLVLVLGLFTAYNAHSGPYEMVTRISMRHYDFAFPLLFMIIASQLSIESLTIMFKWRAITAIPIGAAILYATFTHMTPYTPNIVDCPELFAFTFNSTVFYILSGLSLFSLVLWIWTKRAGVQFFIYFFLPLVIVSSSLFISLLLRGWRGTTDTYDKAGLFTKQYLSKGEVSKVVVVGSEIGSLFRSLFYLDNPNSALASIPEGSTYDLSTLPKGKEWILVIGNHPLPNNISFQLPLNGFTLAHVTGVCTIDFKRSTWPGVVARTEGLSSAEAWGTFSSGDIVILEFSMPLPEKFSVHLVAAAFGPNVGKGFVAHVGDETSRFTLNTSPEEKILRFVNPQKSRTITIVVPSPVSPKELGLSTDERRLGIGFFELRIEPL